jgi:hypothetical protein
MCPLDSPHLVSVMTLLNELNHRLRLVKFTVDPIDGEITVFSDLAIIDSQPTSAQVLGLLGFVMDRLREHSDRIEETIRTGVDPGETLLLEDPSDDIID